MAKALKTSELSAVPPTHVDVFVENYDMLRRWAVQLSEGDRERAEDLLHDCFLHFTVTKPDLSQVNNLEPYLYVIMRNLHLSQVRRQTRTPLRSLSVVDFDTVNVSLWASDPRDRIRMRDELVAICQYACIRKESSKAGSVLILRFFHGYYPDEIAQIMRVTRPAVKERLRLARAEAKLYLEDPAKLRFLDNEKESPTKFNKGAASEDLRKDLRRSIFETRRGEHLAADRFGRLYKTEKSEGPETAEFAHIVSCGSCLDEVNSILEIAPLAERYAEDTVGKDPGSKGGGGGTGGGGRNMLDSFIGRSNELYYHEPQELCVSVNGHLQGLQRVASDINEMMLIIDTTETVGFVEVFSEQGIRLLMLNVEAPPAGDSKQSANVTLSDGRTLRADLSFNGAFPALKVIYNDPSLAADPIEINDAQSANLAKDTEARNLPSWLQTKEQGASGIGSALKTFGDKLRGFHISTWLQPARLTAALAALLIIALVWLKFAPTTTVSAADLLTKSVDAEVARLANKDRLLHRTYGVEEIEKGQVVSRKRIDVWHSAERGITARRIYDDQGRLAMGDWRSANGIQTIYERGAPAKLAPIPQNRGTSISFDDAWQLSLTAKEFLDLIGSAESAAVETRDNEYVVSYTRQEGTTNGIVSASIVLSKEDLHAVEQSLTLTTGDDPREVHLKEVSYEWRPADTVAPAVFEPNIELTGNSAAQTARTQTKGADAVGDESNVNSNASVSPAANIATAALEVEVIAALNGAGAFMGEQVSVQRTSAGQIQVNALVETDKRKAELLDALASVKGNPAVRINIETVAEVQAREATKRKGATGATTVDSVQATENSSPVYQDLRRRFSENEARAYADRVLRHGAEARRHALAMKQLSDRFSISDLASLSAGERAKWIGLLRGHAEKFMSESDALARDLQIIFPDSGGGSASSGVPGNDKEIQAAVRRLYDLSVSVDEDLRGSFAVLTSGSSAEVKTAKFWRTLDNALAAARSLQSVR